MTEEFKFEIKTDTNKDLVIRSWEHIAFLHDQLFGSGAEKFRKRFEEKPVVITSMAFVGAKFVGFKMAYELEPGILYSWMGGVGEEYRRYGVATKLMSAQHAWAMQNGYNRIVTKSTNHFVPMIILNLKSGFKIVGVEEDNGKTKVVMHKDL